MSAPSPKSSAVPEPAAASPETASAPPSAPVAPTEGAAPLPERHLATSAWVSTTYFAEGLPYMLVRFLSGVYFTDVGMKEALIGYLNWLGIPWNLKFLWAPVLDWAGTKRGWMLRVQLAISVLAFALAGLVALGPKSAAPAAPGAPAHTLSWSDLAGMTDPLTGLSEQTIFGAILAVLVLLAFFSATNDVAIDAYYIEGLPDRRDQAAYSGLRVMVYRVAVLFAKFALVGFSAWVWGFGLGALVMAALTLFHVAFAPRFPSDRAKPAGERVALLPYFGRALVSFLRQERIGVVLAFIALYKLGDEMLFSMNSTFLLRELHVSKAQFSWLSGAVGMTTSIVGTLLGAWWIKRAGLKRAIFPLTLLMNVNIWAYVWLAWSHPDAQSASGMTVIALLHGYEQLAAGLGQATLTVFLLYTCKPDFKAAHYAIGSALMSLGGNLFGGYAGRLVEAWGYVRLYEFAFLCSVPSMVLLFFLPIRDDAGRAQPAPAKS